MEITNFSDFEKNPKLYFEKIYEMGKPLIITKTKGKDIVVMSKAEYDGMQETLYLFNSPKNAERLLKSIEANKLGKVTIKKLIE